MGVVKLRNPNGTLTRSYVKGFPFLQIQTERFDSKPHYIGWALQNDYMVFLVDHINDTLTLFLFREGTRTLGLVISLSTSATGGGP